jgi:hypothetical protein
MATLDNTQVNGTLNVTNQATINSIVVNGKIYIN